LIKRITEDNIETYVPVEAVENVGSKKNDIFGSMRFLLPEHREMYLRIKEEERRALFCWQRGAVGHMRIIQRRQAIGRCKSSG
ncbi:hypothetical protein Q3F21_27140, partial [Brevibacillus borstelensis]